MQPVIVAAAQVANKDEGRLVSSLDLILEAVGRATAGLGPGLHGTLDAVYTTPASVFAEGSTAQELATRLGLAGAATVESGYSGCSPQQLLAAACDEIVAGRARSVLLAGGVADASVRRARQAGVAPPGLPTAQWSQGTAAPPSQARQARFNGHRGHGDALTGLTLPVSIFAMLESTLAFRSGHGPPARREWLGRLLAPFSAVAATHPDLAWFPVARQAEEISAVHPANRLVAQPYTKLMASFPTVDLAAALVVTSEEMADQLHIPQDQRVYPVAAASCHEPYPPLGRPDIAGVPALHAAVERAAAGAAQDLAAVTFLDVYSCFPAAIALCAGAVGVDPLAHPLTVTGGLPYFGGPGAGYQLHALVTLADALRRQPEATAATIGLGGFVGDFSAGVYRGTPPERPWRNDLCLDVEAQLRTESVAVEPGRHGWAEVEAMTVVHDRNDGPFAAPVFARFADGTRVGASLAVPAMAADLDGTSLVGQQVRIEVRDGQPCYWPSGH